MKEGKRTKENDLPH